VNAHKIFLMNLIEFFTLKGMIPSFLGESCQDLCQSNKRRSQIDLLKTSTIGVTNLVKFIKRTSKGN